MKKLKEHSSLMPVVLLVLLCQWTLWVAFGGILKSGIETAGFGLTIRNLAAIGLTIACIVSYFYIRSYYRIVLFITLLTGLLNVVSFTPYEIYFSMRIWYVVPLKVQPLVAIITLVALAQMLRRNPRTADVPVLNAEALQDFKERYYAYDTEKLEEIVHEGRYVPEALEAARQVLQERITTAAENV